MRVAEGEQALDQLAALALERHVFGTVQSLGPCRAAIVGEQLGYARVIPFRSNCLALDAGDAPRRDQRFHVTGQRLHELVGESKRLRRGLNDLAGLAAERLLLLAQFVDPVSLLDSGTKLRLARLPELDGILAGATHEPAASVQLDLAQLCGLPE